MTDQPNDGVCFIPIRGVEAAYLGSVLVGSVRPHLAGWRSFLAGEPATPCHGARDADAAREALRRHVRDFYDALHTPLAPGQVENLSRVWVA